MLKIVNETEEYKGFAEIGIPENSEREYLLNCRDVYVRFFEKNEFSHSYEIYDNLDSITLMLYMDSDYRGSHFIKFLFKCSIDDVPSVEVKFTTPKVESKGYSMEHKLFMEYHTEDMLIFKNDSIGGKEVEWSLEMWAKDNKIDEEMVEDCYNQLKVTAANIIKNMECEFWLDYSPKKIRPNYYDAELYSGREWSSYTYDVFEGKTNLGTRAYLRMRCDEEVFIDFPESINKVYMGYFAFRYHGPDCDVEHVEEKFELEVSEEGLFKIVNATNYSAIEEQELCSGRIIPNHDIVYCEMNFNRENYSDYVVYKDRDGVVRVFATEEGGYRDEYARIIKTDSAELYKDEDETQLHKKYCISTYQNIGEEIGLLYILASLILND